MDCHIQLEERVSNQPTGYHRSGNVLLDRILGATLYSFAEGENEAGADRAVQDIADGLSAKGKTPYIIHLGPGHAPLGALGYVVAAREILEQINDSDLDIHEIVVATGSGATHAGLLFGLRAMGCHIPVKGICVRRSKEQQTPRIITRCQEISQLLDMDNPVKDSDIEINDDVLAPGYGTLNDAVLAAIKAAAHNEGIILDPVYTGRAMAGFLSRARQATADQNLMFIHTGGQPAIFGYEDALEPVLSDPL
jgi:D-cysteine desulfhydrase/L-cysteate sulfo-lyase